MTQLETIFYVGLLLCTFVIKGPKMFFFLKDKWSAKTLGRKHQIWSTVPGSAADHVQRREVQLHGAGGRREILHTTVAALYTLSKEAQKSLRLAKHWMYEFGNKSSKYLANLVKAKSGSQPIPAKKIDSGIDYMIKTLIGYLWNSMKGYIIPNQTAVLTL